MVAQCEPNSIDTSEQTQLSAGMRVMVRGQEGLVTKVEFNTLGNNAVTCTGISPLVRDYQATFLTDLDHIEPVDPTRTIFVPDQSPRAARSHLFIESMLRSTAPTDGNIHVGNRAAMDSLPYQLVPARQALSQPRQRILIADAVGLGKTLEAGILMSELIVRHKGRRILVITAKSMMAQFQKEMWDRFTIPLVSLDSSRISQVRADIPANANPFSYYDKVIVSIDTLKRDIEYGAALDASYWDIIVIDEAQNVADRGGARRAQRARLAQRLSSRSDTLIMLSATPHDGKPRSFASLMNMLDPMALPDPENYNKDDIKQLYVRRFKKDVSSDVSGNFPDRKVTQEQCRATAVEEETFDYLTNMHLKMDVNRHASNAGLFVTLLEKSLFSSPAACMKTIDERLKRLSKSDPTDATGDAEKLIGLHDALERISPEQFSRYQRLVAMLRSDSYGWTGKDTADRIVIFTERIETKSYLEQHLREDLKLPKGAIVSMDGQLTDIEQQGIVEEFGNAKSPIRILIASDVASEGLNLHYLSHRLIHFDTPWSLMVFQQRNGRIDRYGQKQQPDIRFMTIESSNEKIKGDNRILEILRDKEQQAYKDIGDPALLMGKFDTEAEESVTRQAIESGESAERFASRLAIPVQDIDDTGTDTNASGSGTDSEAQDDGIDLLAYFGIGEDGTITADDSDDSSENRGTAEEMSSVPDDSTARNVSLMSDYAYVTQALDVPEIKASAHIKSASTQPETQSITVTFAPDSPLRSWLRRRVPSMEILKEDIAEWSADKAYCDTQANSLVAQLRDDSWNRTQYLWALNPITEWVGLKASSLLYRRGEAPIIGIRNTRMTADDTIILMSGMIANDHAAPVIDEWFGAHYQQGAFKEFLTLDEVWQRTGYQGSLIPGSMERQYINRDDNAATGEQISQAQAVLDDAVNRSRQRLEVQRERYRKQSDAVIDEQLTRISVWQTERNAVIAGRPEAAEQQRHVHEIYEHYQQWVEQSYTASGEPVIRVAAAFTGVNQ